MVSCVTNCDRGPVAGGPGDRSAVLKPLGPDADEGFVVLGGNVCNTPFMLGEQPLTVRAITPAAAVARIMVADFRELSPVLSVYR